MRKQIYRCPRRAAAFTLIEMLVVIGIIALLAGLIVPLSGIVNQNKIRARARAQLSSIETAIGSYKAKKGFYPPDNPENPRTNQLFYELRGTTRNDAKTIQTQLFTNLFNLPETINGTTIQTYFGSTTGGFMNSSSDPGEIYNAYPNLKADEIRNINTKTNQNANLVWIFASVSKGPRDIQILNGSGQTITTVNPVCYVSSNPTNNPNSYDLWIDVMIAGKTNRISNWSKDPEVIYQP